MGNLVAYRRCVKNAVKCIVLDQNVKGNQLDACVETRNARDAEGGAKVDYVHNAITFILREVSAYVRFAIGSMLHKTVNCMRKFNAY
jgi:hypothetical protein